MSALGSAILFALSGISLVFYTQLPPFISGLEKTVFLIFPLIFVALGLANSMRQ